MKERRAFTLVEMLVVIAIIGIVAALVVNLSSIAKNKQHEAQVNAMKAKLTLMIDQYHAKLNFYPPDNSNMANTNISGYALNYDGWAATNPLLYELTGGSNIGKGIYTFYSATVPVNEITYQQLFGREGLANANTDEPQNFYRPLPSPKDFTNYSPAGPITGAIPNDVIWGLTVTVPVQLTNISLPNFWHYDASSPNRHNINSYDLWAEYIVGSKGGSNIIMTNGNWP